MCIGRNEYEEAMKLFQHVLELDPTNVAVSEAGRIMCSLKMSPPPPRSYCFTVMLRWCTGVRQLV
ncbi:unnamed protein product [Echinostoma caproni]|uniref:Uncharacterized protein n=1 Tax=Echinostoma caproni TaxID=27848 RepID=A0A3P8LBV5_9TREM|nr:unnamed protein product [Echinostoma caproni]